MIRYNHREFNDKAECDRYKAGYRSYPRWPVVGINGNARDAEQGSIEAMGWYDAEREEEERMGRRGN